MVESSTICTWLKLSRRVAVAALFAAPLVHAAPTFAQDYPNRPIRMIVPFPPGGSTDAAARMVAAEMGNILKQSITVDNRPGASGNIGVDAVARSQPDGHTMGMGGSGANVMNPIIGPVPEFKSDDVVFVGNISLIEFALIVRKDFPANNVQEFISVLKANPGKYRYGEGGAPARLGFERFKSLTGANIVHVPYKGDVPVITDIIGGHVDASFSTVAGSLGFIRSGSLKALAIPSLERSKAIPSLPTVSESGLPGFEVSAAGYLIVPKGTPDAIVQKLNSALREATRKPEIVAKYTELGLASLQQTPAETTASVRKDIEIWAQVAKDAGLAIAK